MHWDVTSRPPSSPKMTVVSRVCAEEGLLSLCLLEVPRDILERTEVLRLQRPGLTLTENHVTLRQSLGLFETRISNSVFKAPSVVPPGLRIGVILSCHSQGSGRSTGIQTPASWLEGTCSRLHGCRRDSTQGSRKASDTGMEPQFRSQLCCVDPGDLGQSTASPNLLAYLYRVLKGPPCSPGWRWRVNQVTVQAATTRGELTAGRLQFLVCSAVHWTVD